MDWESYRNTFRNFQNSLSQTLILTLIAKDVLNSWPYSLPQEIKRPLDDALVEISKILTKSKAKGTTSDEWKRDLSLLKKGWSAGEFALYRETINLYMFSPSASSKGLDFTRIIYSQALVILYAHFDAFMADSLRAICSNRPEVLRCGKQMQWDDILLCGSWDKLLDQLVEEFVFEFGWKSIRDRLTFFEDRLGLPISFEEDKLKSIEDSELIRHVITHNGGNVSQKYIDKSGYKDLSIGQPVTITADLVDVTCAGLRYLADHISAEIAKKFYDQPAASFF